MTLATFVMWPMLTAALVSLATGLILCLGSKWGLVQNWWVVVKLVRGTRTVGPRRRGRSMTSDVIDRIEPTGQRSRMTDAAAANRTLFIDAFSRFAAGDVDVLREIMHEDFIEHSPRNPSGRDAFVAFISEAPISSSDLVSR